MGSAVGSERVHSHLLPPLRLEFPNPTSRSMPSSPPAAGSSQEELEMVSGEASLPLHAAETGAGGDGEAPSSSEEESDSSDGGEDSDDMDEDEESSGSSDDSDMEDGEEEDEEEDTDSSSDYSQSQEPDDEQLAADRVEADRIWKEMKKTKKEEAEGDGVHHRNPAPAVASCCVCMEPWTSDGAHRICCIPCGHVYGRSCLEKWLRRCGGTLAKCPQCSECFEHKKIINLHGTEYIWNDCIHDQEQKRLVSQALDQLKETKETCLKTEKRTVAMQMMVVRIDKEMTEFRAEVASLMEKMTRMIINKGGDDTATPTPDGMLEFLSRNWPELPRSRWGHE